LRRSDCDEWIRAISKHCGFGDCGKTLQRSLKMQQRSARVKR